MKAKPAELAGPWSHIISARPRLTARALRLLGRSVPANIRDDEVIELVERPA